MGLRSATVLVSSVAVKIQDLESQPISPRLRPVVSNVKTRRLAPNDTATDFTAGSAFGSPAMLNRTSYFPSGSVSNVWLIPPPHGRPTLRIP